MNPLCISRLIESGASVWIPADSSDIVIIDRGIGLEKCLCQNASVDEDHAPILRCPDKPILVAVADRSTKTVWLMPSDLMTDRTILRLGKRCDEYILPEPLSLSSEEQRAFKKEKMSLLREAAIDAARKAAEHGMTGE